MNNYLPTPQQSEPPVASLPKMPAQASTAVDKGPIPKQDFLDRFVKSASMDPSSADVLRAAGITTVEKLGGFATQMYNTTNNFGKEKMKKAVPMTMAPVEQGRLVDALLRLGKSLN